MRLATLTVALLLAAQSAMSETKEKIQYTLRFPAASSHYVDVEARVPAEGKPQVELFMAVWTPGSYLVREYERNVEDVRAVDESGRERKVEKTRKNRWSVDSAGAQVVVVSYRVYGHEMGVRSNYVERDFAFLNGAPTFLSLPGDGPRPHEVRIERPAQWSTVVTALDAVAPDTWTAPDYDVLVDSPIGLGNPQIYPFAVDGIEHRLVNDGEGGVWDGPRSAADTEKIVRAARALWGFIPYPRYVFFNFLTESSGGLEHKASTLLLTSRYKTRSRKAYLGWLSLVAHEHFHAWNVKRLRPRALGPFDYEAEVYTKDLWLSEGVTDYYADVLVRRAGLMTDKEYLRALAEPIDKVETTPGRKVQSLEMASFDAWIKHYRPDENTSNTAIDYYAKGAVVGFLLDATIREHTSGRKSLDDVMRLAYERFSGEHGFASDEFQRTASEVAGRDLSPFFAATLEGTGELDYAPALRYYGLRFKAEKKKDEDDDDKPEKGWLGLVLRTDGGRITVAQVKRDAPGYAAGVSPDDEIVAVGGFRVRPEQWDGRLEAYKPGETVELLVARRDRLVSLRATFAKEPTPRKLEVLPDRSDEQKKRLAAWLGAAAP
ncbi:MAG TPA: PDZ domain-containing protein [Vicinamibacteria bacterium]|nr:PDZ domain-containing protein [Vicinamibacteria bacterium]